MKVLLTGASGFLGSQLAKALIHSGHQVLAFRRQSTDLWRLSREKNQIIWFDSTSEKIEAPFHDHGKIDVVIHAATCYGRNGEITSEILDANLNFPVRLFEIAARHHSLAFFNTDTYFNTGNNSCSYLDKYTLSKKHCLDWLKASAGKTRVINLKLFHIFGEHDDPRKFTSHIIRHCIENAPIDLTPGEQKRDFIHVSDVAAAYIHLLASCKDASLPFASYDVGTGAATSIKEFAQTVRELAHSSSELRFGALPYRENEIMTSQASITELTRTGWTPRLSLKDGIQRTLDGLEGARN
jgi:CDP-paratose synthetase